MKKRGFIAGCMFLLAVSGCGQAKDAYFTEAFEQSAETETACVYEEEDTTKALPCFVYICGAVAQPGVYELPAKSRVYEAVRMAGGLTTEACEDSVNQAEEVTDGQMIKVLTEQEAAEAQEVEKNETPGGKVNINSADAAELMTIPGIGASKAESILAYRRESGGFASVEEIMNITGIKEGVYSRIKDYITVN